MSDIKSTDYTVDELLDRIYDEVGSSGKSKINISAPKIKNENKKTYVLNFRDMCVQLNRDENMVLNFITHDTQLTASVTEKGVLIINNILRQPQIEKTYKAFVKTFVQCPACKSQDTKYFRKDKIDFISCNKCHADKSINLADIK